MMRYGNWEITHNPKPVPMRGFDWDYCHRDFDGAPDSGDRRCGYAASATDAMKAIDEIEDEMREEEIMKSKEMSLRDYFAGQALIALLAESAGHDRRAPITRHSYGAYAKDCYEIADAMLVARAMPRGEME